MGFALPPAAVALALAATCTLPGRPIVAEVVYDAPGDDTGHEFVELYNPYPADAPLAGLKLQSGDGAAPARWTTRWTGGVRDTIRAHARFVIGGALVVPVPDAVVTLELQNGPDAMRLVWPDGAVEVLGWGALAYPEYSCGAPAADVAAGQSLARVPDDADLGGNALDFRAADPSPGRANQPPVDLALVRGTLVAVPENPEPFESLRVSLALVNRGALLLAGDSLALAGDALAEAVRARLPDAAPGETLRVVLAAAAGAAGRRALVALALAPGDAELSNDADTLAVRVGPGPLELTEIQFHPAAGEGEWAEVRNRSGGPLALAGFTFSDAADARARVTGDVTLAPDSLALIAQDRGALLAAYPGLDSTRIAGVSAWPALNNTDGEGGVADRVTLREADGLAADRMAYSAAHVPAGATLEKEGGAWHASIVAGGTPLAPPARAETGGEGLRVTPRRLRLPQPEAEFAWSLPWSSARVTLELYDLAGRRVARLLDAAPSGASGLVRVRLDGAGPGVFVAVLRATSGGAAWSRTAALRIVGAAP